MSVVTSIINAIVSAFNGILTGLGSGVADFFQTLFLANDGTGNLSVFAIVSLVFIGVAVALGIARWIIKKVGG